MLMTSRFLVIPIRRRCCRTSSSSPYLPAFPLLILIWIEHVDRLEQKQAAVTKSAKELESITTKIKELTSSIEEADTGREDTVRSPCPLPLPFCPFSLPPSPSSLQACRIKLVFSQAERRKLLSILADLKSTSEGLKSELAAFGAADPARYERKRRAVEVAKDAAVRWTGQLTAYLSTVSWSIVRHWEE